MSFDDFKRERGRLEVLRALSLAKQYTENEVALAVLLTLQGYAMSRQQLRVDLAFLEQSDCIVLQKPGGLHIATLTLAGQECCTGLVDIPGIAKPRPGE